MDDLPSGLQREVAALVDRYRARCLWFLHKDFYTVDTEGAVRTIDYLRKHGYLEAFKKASQLKQCLLTRSNSPSAD